MITFAFTLLAFVLVAFTVVMLVISIKENREIKNATLKRSPRPTQVNVSGNLITAEEAA